MPRVLIPPPYRGPTQGTAELEVEGETVLGCLEAVEQKFPGLLPLVMDEEGGLHRFVKVFRNGDLLVGDVVQTRVDPTDEIEILAAIAGG
jgi:molybdopterin converting factor small subunit